MKKLIGGSMALVLGTILFSCSSDDFIKLCLGTIPAILIISGGIAIYFSYINLYDELNEEERQEASDKDRKGRDEDSNKETDAVQPAFWGNTQSLIFHDPKCNFAQSKKCTQPFPDKESAISAGYSPCGICEP